MSFSHISLSLFPPSSLGYSLAGSAANTVRISIYFSVNDNVNGNLSILINEKKILTAHKYMFIIYVYMSSCYCFIFILFILRNPVSLTYNSENGGCCLGFAV